MYISNLVLHGFKSFGQRTSLTFGEGITSVVGPNGCGKTNIVDALRWVLGEQKQSVLRSSRMEEVIFHGSRSHKPSGLSEVTLTIHNNKSTLPLEYTDIEISRRLYRDGESEFLINRNPCRLKDILDLFMDTGIASDAYSVIELKMIEAILSDIEDDRRRMFEEASGINKYKRQRRSAQRKLEVTRQDLERVNDIISEVENQVHFLRLQLKRFERHKKLSADLKHHEVLLAQLQLKTLIHDMSPIETALESGRDSHQAEALLIAQDEEQLKQLRETYDEREQTLKSARQSMADSTNLLNELKEKQLVWREQQRATQQGMGRFEQERKEEVQRSQSYTSTIAQAEKDLHGLNPALEKMREAFKTCQAEEETVSGEYMRGEQHLQSARERKFNHRHLVQEEESRRRRTEEIIHEKRQELERLEVDIKERSASLEELQGQRASTDTSRKKLEARIAEEQGAKERISAELQELEELHSVLQTELQDHATQASVLESRLEVYTELKESHEGYPSGAREVLSGRTQFPGLLGAVADLVDIKPVHATAVEMALGPFAACLVVETVSQANQMLTYAQEEDLGRLSIIPLERIGATGDSPPENPSGVFGTPLFDLVTVPSRLEELFRRLLAGYYWVEDKKAVEPDLPPGVHLVTPEGHLLGAIPYLTHLGTSTQDKEIQPGHSSLVGRAGEVERIQKAIRQISEGKSGIETRLGENATQQAELRDKRELAEKGINSIREELEKTNREITQLDYEHRRINDDLAALKLQNPTLHETLQGLEENLAAHDKVLDHLREQESGMDEDIGQAEIAYEEVREKRDAWQARSQELRVELLTVENQRENLAERKLSVEDALKASTERIAQLESDRDQAGITIENLTRQLAEAEEQRAGLEKEVHSLQSAVEQKEQAVQDIREQTTSLEEEIRNRQHGRETALSQQQELELKLTEFRSREELIRSRIQELYHEEIPDEDLAEEQRDEETLRWEIEKIRASLERIGPINMAVAEEYEEETKRLDFLTEQRDDLLQAVESLDETIRRIDRQAREQFQETYDQIRHHFKQTFRLFFEGGEGDLRLVGNPDPLEADIEIIARPPGKKTRSLRALSGGEKALTAIALLFAIYMVKPSPFCILDEVDAPLDDVNIEKFTRVIKQFAHDTQFIIVTHNKLTMQSADYLYGVTMAEEGLSSLVSVNLSEYAT
jgi:chromosome segregation protein